MAKRNLICQWIGHKPPTYFDGPGYGHAMPTAIDGMGTEHAIVTGDCDRCGTKFTICHIHLPARKREEALERRLKQIKEAVS